MKLTNKNRIEMKTLAYFAPSFLQALEPDDESIQMYFDWSDRGIGSKEVELRIAEESRTHKYTYLSALYWGKRNRDLQITSYRADWGHTVTAWDFEDEPREIAEFIAKALRKPEIMRVWIENNPRMA